MAHQGPSQFSRLPVQLLVQVLRHVGPQHALRSCALVCSDWRAAAAVSVKDICIKDCSRNKARSLTHWLQTHNLLEVERLDVTKHVPQPLDRTLPSSNDSTPSPRLVLPVPQLKQLVSIKLECLTVTSASDAGEPGLLPWLGPALAGVTQLTLHKCEVQLQGLHTLTNLQRLDIVAAEPQPSGSSSSGLAALNASKTAVLAEAVPQLLALTTLCLAGGVCQDAAVAHISRLTRLQGLELQQCHSGCTASSFASLPPSLTRLEVSYMHTNHQPSESLLLFSPSSTPGICQLTALQNLCLKGDLVQVNAAVLSALTALTALDVRCRGLTQPQGLAALTRLQDLLLYQRVVPLIMPAAVVPADFAAITASQQLTCMCLFNSPITQQQLSYAFPARRQLPNLVDIAFGMNWLLNAAGMASMVSCCPNLISMHCQGGLRASDALDVQTWADGLAALSNLERLKLLVLGSCGITLSQPVCQALAGLTGLGSLQIWGLQAVETDSILQLSACRQLTSLRISMFGGSALRMNVFSTAPRGSPPNVWSQLPDAISQLVPQSAQKESVAG